jgi:hypothetical protein
MKNDRMREERMTCIYQTQWSTYVYRMNFFLICDLDLKYTEHATWNIFLCEKTCVSRKRVRDGKLLKTL